MQKPVTNDLTSPVTDIDVARQAYPVVALPVDLARNVWNGHSPTVKIEFALSDRLRAEFLNLTGRTFRRSLSIVRPGT
jgi:hypothetical protein